MKTVILAAAAAGMLLLVSSEAIAQERFAVELRGGGAVPTKDIGEDGLGAGFGFEGTVRYRFLPHLAAYAGWNWIHFSPEESFAGPSMDFEETGYAFGLRFEHPFAAGSRTAGWLRAGGTYAHIEIEDRDGDTVADTDHGLGWDVGAGLAVRAGSGWSFTPGVRYRSLSRDVELGTPATTVDLNYLALEIGIARSF